MLAKARVLYRDWASACQKIDVEDGIQKNVDLDVYVVQTARKTFPHSFSNAHL